jgi:cyclophilin family peptidyl-prolyl cis-trans isomerase
MKLNKKRGLALAFIFIFLVSSAVAFSGLFTKPAAQSVVFETTLGTIEVELYADKAPVTVSNFVRYVDEHFYDGTVFHRVTNLAGFKVVQGGGFTATAAKPATHEAIKLETGGGLKNLKGTIAMARSSAANSATSQFYFNVIDHPGLDPSPGVSGYAVFGKVVQGWDVVEKIDAVTTGIRTVGGYQYADWPISDVVITRAYAKR